MNAPTLFVIAADLTKMQVVANIDESDVGRMRPGQVVSFRVDAYPTDTFLGAVEQVRLQPAVVQNVVVYSTVIAVPNPQLKLKPGMTATVGIEIARRNNVLRVPTAAVRFRPTEAMFTVAQPAGAARSTARPGRLRRPRRRARTVAGAARDGGGGQGAAQPGARQHRRRARRRLPPQAATRRPARLQRRRPRHAAPAVGRTAPGGRRTA